MKLNTHSYVHLKVRCLCNFIEQKTGLQLVTNLADNFSVITFQDAYSYINIFYKKCVYTSLNRKLDITVRDAIEDIIMYLAWLDIGNAIAEKRVRKAKINKKRGCNDETHTNKRV